MVFLDTEPKSMFATNGAFYVSKDVFHNTMQNMATEKFVCDYYGPLAEYVYAQELRIRELEDIVRELKN